MLRSLPPASVFRHYDIRGTAGENGINTALAYALGRVFPLFCQQLQRPVAVGHDARLSSPALYQSLCQGLLDAGMDVVELGLTATPLVYFSVFHESLAGCIQVTASHNPADDNGFKIMVGQQSLYGDDIQRLRMAMTEPWPAARRQGQRRLNPHLLADYLQRFAADCQVQRRLKVVVDAGNGPAGLMAVPLYEAAGCEVIPLYCEPDGRFPHHHPDPVREENLRDLKRAVLTHQADLGLAFDGDGDRLGVVDEQGKTLPCDMLLLILARDVLRHHAGATIISESKSSRRLYEGIEAAGGIAAMHATGHALIKAAMRQTGALLGGELTGHIFYADRFFGYDDAVYAGARLLQVLAQQHQPLSGLLDDVPPVYNTPELRYPCDESKKFMLEEEARQWFSQQGYTVSMLDGVRIILDDGSWGLLRASHTQPVLVARFEAESEQGLAHIRRLIEGWLEERLGHLSTI